MYGWPALMGQDCLSGNPANFVFLLCVVLVQVLLLCGKPALSLSLSLSPCSARGSCAFVDAVRVLCRAAAV